MSGSPLTRKKWSEAEEKTLIDKYGKLFSNGILPKMRTREKKYKPIAFYVNCMHHDLDPVAYPWQWTWKDVSTKVQNMKHQYLLVKQKIKNPELRWIRVDSFNWQEGVSYWSNFLAYKEVFGDVPLANNPLVGPSRDDENDHDFNGGGNGLEIVVSVNREKSRSGDFESKIDGGDNGEKERDGNFNGSSNHLKDEGDDGLVYEEVEGNRSECRRKKECKDMEKKAWGFIVSQVKQLREMQTCFEQRDAERERERQQRYLEQEKKWERKMEEMEKEREKTRKRLWMEEWEGMEKERERRRREEMLNEEREWEERMNQRRSEWTNRMDEMLSQHRAEMGQLQSRIWNEQQNLVSHLLLGISDHTSSATNHYLSQMMHNLHHHDDTRVEGDNQDQQFIVDG